MPALGFQQQHVAAVIDGSKPFTMRKPRKDGREARVGGDLFLFENWRTPEMRRFATATCVMRTTLWFDEVGIAKVRHDGLDPLAPPIFMRVSNALLDCASAVAATREKGLHQLAVFDGFGGWRDLWEFHSGQGLEPDGLCKRNLIGIGGVKPEPDANGFLPPAAGRLLD